MSKANEGKQKPAPGKSKIDTSKAMVLMGFKTSRTLEVASFDERRQILDAQLFTRMQEVQVSWIEIICIKVKVFELSVYFFIHYWNYTIILFDLRFAYYVVNVIEKSIYHDSFSFPILYMKQKVFRSLFCIKMV